MRRRSEGRSLLRRLGCLGCLALLAVAAAIAAFGLWRMRADTAHQLAEPAAGLERALTALGLDAPPPGFLYGFSRAVPGAYRLVLLSSEPIAATHWPIDRTDGAYLLLERLRGGGDWPRWSGNPRTLWDAVARSEGEFLPFEPARGEPFAAGEARIRGGDLVWDARRGGIRADDDTWGGLTLFAVRCDADGATWLGAWARSDAPAGEAELVGLFDGAAPCAEAAAQS